ncbi:hypothetical protein C361_00605 [Cryptococcus neoformans Tu259-1]|uniref:Calpain catalytic domain-containing protein n=1 Tax=Cryptococcus neoformans Tu259-1 TaxID=1230072 RepID=A0A854QP35_CRYNE|nr:hypothetical protein C361_00605 [Cryptococcus neoformans var. grubii Tu259-1]OXG88624.1 hypothetical protein C350_00599 [Cryptococcus neoformans var. grubii MW-RSA36]OXL11081.1 hypothetical protein C348_00599 [Cryptococcus neoformans var. grubii Gb118]
MDKASNRISVDNSNWSIGWELVYESSLNNLLGSLCFSTQELNLLQSYPIKIYLADEGHPGHIAHLVEMINTFFITLLFSVDLTWTHARPTLSPPRPISKRDGAPLFGASGMPSRDDIGQHEGDCGWLSSMAAITTISPSFIKSKFSYSSPSDLNVTDVTVTIFADDTSLTAQSVPVTYHSQLINNDNEDTSIAWWPGAYDSAAVYSGILPSTNGSLNPVGVPNALRILTGKEAAWEFKGDLGDEAWEVLSKGTKTPVVLQTFPTGAVELVGGHAYAVLNTSIAVNGTKMVALFNPWGNDVVYTYDTAMNDCYLLAWLKKQ